ncbi:transmembrane protein [Cystoisospora suis]|uniref:Transmembrane protein n=1 Tax=Cystoisospora suis TaxID=483139 RepID=A0A2C6KJJ7_9APIC|nr:transmembrane protein [Cystoisospora suis]
MAAQGIKMFLVICLLPTALVSLLLPRHIPGRPQRRDLSPASFAFLFLAVTAAKQLPSPQTSGSRREGKDEGLRVEEFLRADDPAHIQKLTQSFQASVSVPELSAFVSLRFFSPSFRTSGSCSSRKEASLLTASLCRAVQERLVSSLKEASGDIEASSLRVYLLLRARTLLGCHFKVPRVRLATVAWPCPLCRPGVLFVFPRQPQMRNCLAGHLRFSGSKKLVRAVELQMKKLPETRDSRNQCKRREMSRRKVIS